MANISKGNCFVCGCELGKAAMKTHILKTHCDLSDGEECYLLKVEGRYDKNYWLLLDISTHSLLDDLDAFLREIWLECCGHMSAFRLGRQKISKDYEIGALPVGFKFTHEYDFGSPTETLITILSVIRRPKHRESVRLLARNVPPEFVCSQCGKPAEVLCAECIYSEDSPFFCEKCAEKHDEHDFTLPVVNSPRMGVCGYDGEMDIWTFVP